MAQSTANPQVSILSDCFDMPPLDTCRRIWLYLPTDYDTSGDRYPVLYLLDGQNIFDDATSYIGEWHVDESLFRMEQGGFSGNNTNLGSGHHQRIVSPSYQGNIPLL